MTDADANRVKLLFVVSNDFGELSSAIYFAMGQAFKVTVALPPSLFAVHRGHLPVSSCLYQLAGDVLAIVDRERPDVVVLFSGYLFGINNIFSVDTLKALVSEMRRRCRLVTSDPFLGLMGRLNASVFSDSHPKKAWLMEHFANVAESMRGASHLYMAEAPKSDRHPTLSFFNERIIVPPAEMAGLESKLQQSIAVHPQKKRWTFVLSSEDYAMQTAVHGRGAFDALLARKMQEASRAGRQPVLIAPKPCIDAVAAFSQTIDHSILLPFCNYTLFMAIAVESEYLFYWNIFSDSILARVANRRPVVFFNAGHMAYAMPPLHALGLATYYGNAPLPYLSQTLELDEKILSDLALAQEEPLAKAMARLRQLPSVTQVVETILAG